MTIDEAPGTGIGMERLLRRGSIAIAVVMGFRTFQFFPGMVYVQEAWYAACFLLVLFVYSFWKTRIVFRFTQLELYILLLMSADISLAGRSAQEVFGQPLAYGILSQRGIVLIAGWLILATMLHAGTLKHDDVESVLLYLAWGTFVLYTSARIFLNPTDFVAYGEGLVTHPMAGYEPSFKFQPYFLVFGVFYYAGIGFRTQRTRYYLAAAILFFAALGGSGRGLAVSVGATLIIILYRMRGIRRGTIAALKFSCLAAVIGGAIYESFPETVSARIAKFSDAFVVTVAGPTTGDPSANARIFETLAALPYVQAHPLLGSGVVSNQWQGGSEMAIGEYFFASDIGIFGIVFSYGILGLFLFAFQYRIAWLAVKRLPESYQSPFLDAIKAFLLFSAFYSLETGMCVWDAGATLFFVTLLYDLAPYARTLNPDDNRTLQQCVAQRLALSA